MKYMLIYVYLYWSSYKLLISLSRVKARRISAKMKAAWASELEANGHLICKMPGCSQTFVTVANYQTHFKYCTGVSELSYITAYNYF